DGQPVDIAPQVEPRRPRRSFRESPDVDKKQQVPLNQPIPVVPPVPVPEKAKPLRNDSLLEAIIKLVGSIMNFKGK
ncbi:MAG TPA: hypothetical protein VNU93_04460, partial [Verrucomicrobiae bacterium]|nr:hypothetical protein [Verrucomicrobiae bacterium]